MSEGAGEELDDVASAGVLGGADSDVGSGISALSSSWSSAKPNSLQLTLRHLLEWLHREDWLSPPLSS